MVTCARLAHSAFKGCSHDPLVVLGHFFLGFCFTYGMSTDCTKVRHCSLPAVLLHSNKRIAVFRLTWGFWCDLQAFQSVTLSQQGDQPALNKYLTEAGLLTTHVVVHNVSLIVKGPPDTLYDSVLPLLFQLVQWSLFSVGRREGLRLWMCWHGSLFPRWQ